MRNLIFSDVNHSLILKKPTDNTWTVLMICHLSGLLFDQPSTISCNLY